MYITYKVKIRIRAGIDDYMDEDFTGVEHTFEKTAQEELKLAQKYIQNDNRLILAYIDKAEVYS